MIGPLSSQLNAIKWGEFSYETIYELQKTTKLLSKKDCVENGKIPLFTSDSKNNGIVGYVNCKPSYKLKKGQCMVVFGDHTRTFNIAKNDFCIADNVKVLKPIKNFSIRILLFINTMWGKKIIDKGYARHWSLAKTAKIQLPLKPTANTQTLKDIDFHFMEKFIAELEQCRLAELEAYLKATGLSNTTLSSDEENALNAFNDKNSRGGNTPCGLMWQSFKLGDLFEVLSSKKIYHANTIKIHDTQIENSYPYVVRATTNNGIKGFIIDDPTLTNEKNTLSFAQDTFTVFYQKQPYFTGNKVKILKPKFAFKSPKILHFISAILQFILKPLTWGLGSTTESIAEFKFSLPLKPTANTQTIDDIDFHFMRTLINALMKQTIQGVVQYSSAKIHATKEAISHETPTQKDSLF
ncbi:restriction endonuclease subunit S [Helicobacter pylori]|uniref:restriction endonuclease subunit S n=2 Tax=Helicobacter pylori TaxID=210 RepID=UPI0011289D70|nr:restriction endonuclease subunit S [Helicobacter pylori]TPH46791.1 restriction endonuclease subunit S [Helicobacter pylori]